MGFEDKGIGELSIMDRETIAEQLQKHTASNLKLKYRRQKNDY